MMSLNVFSQSVIDSTLIRLKKPVARLVIKDLIAGDSYKEELSIVSDKVALLENKIVLKDSIENILLYKIDNLVFNFNFTIRCQRVINVIFLILVII